MNSVKVTANKTNVQKSATFTQTNELPGRDLRKNPIYDCVKKDKITGNKIQPRQIKSCTLKTKTLMKETEEDTNKCKAIPCSWIGWMNIVKMAISSKATYRFNAIPIKKPMAFFTQLEEKILKFICNLKRPWRVKEILTMKNNAGGKELYYKAAVN